MSPDAVDARAARRSVASLSRRWDVRLLAATAALQAVALRGVLFSERLPPFWLYDSVIFEYVGWFVATGGRLYVDAWAIKPPLAFEAPALLALVLGGDMRAYHLGALLLTAAAAVGAAVAVGKVVDELAGRGAAGFLAGLSVYAMPGYGWRVALGFKAKYFVIAFGLFAVYLVLRRRPFAGGLAAAAAAGFWQLGAVFPLLVAALARRDGDARRAVAGIAVGTVAVVLPVVVLWRAGAAMLAEVVFGPLLIPESGTPLGRLAGAVDGFGVAAPLVVVGAYGVSRGLVAAPRRHWWLGAAGAWFAAQVLVLDFDGVPDLFPAFAVAAVGLGLVLARGDEAGRALAWAIVALVVFNAATAGAPAAGGGGNEPAAYPLDASVGPMDVGRPLSPGARKYVFFRQRRIETCRAFASRDQRRLVAAIGGRMDDRTCGDPGRYWDALVG